MRMGVCWKVRIGGAKSILQVLCGRTGVVRPYELVRQSVIISVLYMPKATVHDNL